MRITANFTDEDFLCSCCRKHVMEKSFIDRLQLAREIADIPFIINSGWRCSRHNRAIGGSDTSSHKIGVAVDIATTSSASRFSILRALLQAGFNRIGIGENFIHVDYDENKTQNVIWHYYKH